MNHFTKAFLISSILLSSQQMFADTVTEPVAAENKTVVRGRVLDADNQALPGAYIRFEDGSCTVSDINGYYIMPKCPTRQTQRKGQLCRILSNDFYN